MSFPPAVALWTFLSCLGFLLGTPLEHPTEGLVAGLMLGTGISVWERWKEIKADQARRFTKMMQESDKKEDARAGLQSGFAQAQTPNSAWNNIPNATGPQPPWAGTPTSAHGGAAGGSMSGSISGKTKLGP